MLIPIDDKYPKYKIDTVNRYVVSFNIKPEGRPLVWTSYRGELHIKLCNAGQYKRLTKDKMDKMIKQYEEKLKMELKEYMILRNKSFTIVETPTCTEEEVRTKCEQLAISNMGEVYSYYEKKGTCNLKVVTWS